jgi:galactokinase
MIVMMNAARNAGALGTKIIGSGGGGCMVAIANNNIKDKVIDAFLALNAVNAYEVQLT